MDYVKCLGYDPGQCLLCVRIPKCSSLREIRSDKETIEILKKLDNEKILEAFVYHMVADPELAAPFLKYKSDGEGYVEGESGVSSNKDTENDIGSVDKSSKNSEDAPPFVQPTAHIFATSPHVDHVFSLIEPSNAAPSSSTAAPTSSTAALSESVVDSDVESIDRGVEIRSDVDEYVDEELRGLKEEKRKRKRRKRGKRPVIPERVKLGIRKKGPDTGYDKSVGGDRNNLEGKFAGDEPFYPSNEAASFETDSEDVTDSEDEVEQVEHRDNTRKRKKVNRVVYSLDCQKVVWELGLVFKSLNEFRAVVTKYVVAKHVAIEKCVNEPTRVRIKCTTGCIWLLYNSIDSRSMNFVVKTYNSVHKCDPTNRNRLCNTKFLASHFNERIKEQPDIRIFEFQLLIKKELDLHVGRMVCRDPEIR
ncbi:putative ADP-ribosylation factor GTPase-activating protein AGD14-like [Capsicum annuum]|nr:putative ADP-ribosylation factor GTPase-activating protein AGD14-like [Capsicum annuum]